MDPFLYCQLYLFISQFAPQFFEKEQHAANQALTHVAVDSPVEHTSFLPSTFELSGAAEYDYVYGISQERPSSFRRDLNHAFGDLLTVLIQHYRVFLILILILALIVLYACLHKVIAWPLLRIKTLIWSNTPAPVPVPVPAPAVPDVLMRQLSALPNQFKNLGKDFGDLVRTTRDDVNHLQDFNEQTSERLDSVEEDKIDGTQAVVIFQALSSDMDTRVTGAEVQLEDLSLQGAITSSKVDQLEVQAEKVEKRLENTTQGHVWPQIWKLWDRLDSLQKKVDELTEKVQSLQSSPQGNGDGMSQDLKDELESIKERLAALDPRVKGTEDQLGLIGAGRTSTEIWKALPTLQPAFNDLWKAVKALDKKLDGFAALKGKQQELEAALVDHQRQLETLKKNAALPKADITKADVVRMIQESETRSRSYADEIRRQMSEGLEAVKADNISLRQDLRERFAHDDTRFDNLDGRLTNVSFEKSSRGQRVTNLENEVLRLNRALEDATRTSRERICPCHNYVQKPPGRADLLLAAAPVVEAPFTQASAAPSVPLPPSPAALPEVAVVEPAPQAPAIEDVREVREDSSIGDEPAESSSSKAPTAAQTRPRDARRAVPRSQRGRHAPRADRSDAVAAPAAQFQAPEGYAPAVFPAPTGTPAFVAPSGIPSFPPPTALPLPPAAVEAAASAAIGGFLTSGGAFTRGAFPAPTTPLAPFGSSAPPPFSAPPAPSAPAAAPHTAAIPPSTDGDVLSAVQIQALQGYNSSQPAQQHAPAQPILK
ncbi:hypothetical protein H2201_001658 [Coniosporium apollinis]|uniref:Uncharacterized protein n=1 Tax=Coniosporium apollinis TaxID=61459 RepID=A0ABQ9P5S3_9PEZI|nr:hypothetical protein H2201_001658 [Coniosporium apollinis]